MISNWFTNNYIEVFGAVTGILYVFLEIRQTIWLWPVGIITSAVYIWVFFSGKLYADMSLQGYYLFISLLGWYWWAGRKNGGKREGEKGKRGDGENRRNDEKTGEVLHVTRLRFSTGVYLTIVFIILFTTLRLGLGRFTDSPVPGWDSFITSLSIIATWMLACKIYEHWFLWIVVNMAATILFLTRGLYPTVILYLVYGTMSFAGLKAWRKTISKTPSGEFKNAENE
jgi:nicotinamide mononucleotide transporter